MIRWWLCGIVILLLAPMLLARQGMVKTKDGQTITGDIDADTSDTQVIITVHNVQTVVDKTNVDSITYSDSADAEYQTRLGKLEPTDIPGRMALAQWAFDLQRYDLAHDACQQALAIDPHNSQAISFEDTIQQQMILEHRQADTSGGAPAGGAANGGATPAGAANQSPATALNLSPKYLTANQINIMRQDELTQGDKQVRISFNDDVRRKFITSTGAEAATFFAQSPVDQALAILAHGTDKMIPDVRVLNDPISLAVYRQKIQPMILSGCAASGCHGGGGGGNLFIYSNNSEAASYTNFYILQNFSKSVTLSGQYAAPAPVMRQMIDRTSPDQSLLVQYSLPASAATIPHPPAGNYHGIFQDINDPRCQAMMMWMTQTLVNPAPNYGFKFELPPHTNAKPTTAPSAPAGQ
jgi:hypothetical protein